MMNYIYSDSKESVVIRGLGKQDPIMTWGSDNPAW